MHNIILVSRFLPFICISYPVKVFKFDTEILRDSCTAPLLKTLSRLPQSIALLFQILFLMFACNNFPFHAFVTFHIFIIDFDEVADMQCWHHFSYTHFWFEHLVSMTCSRLQELTLVVFFT